LTPPEWKVMRRHPEIGRELVEKIPFLRGAVPIVYHHHERWDGTGYPAGLRGEAIPLGARIFAVADAFDAMTYDRPYSRAISFDAAPAEIRRCPGPPSDPAIVTAFLTIPRETLVEIREGGGADAAGGGSAEADVLAIPSLARALALVARVDAAPAPAP